MTDERLNAAVATAAAVKNANTDAPRREISHRTPRASLPPAWHCPHPHVVWSDGRVCFDHRYVVGVDVPDPDTFTPPGNRALPPAWKAGVRGFRTPLALLLVLLAASPVLLIFLPIVGVGVLPVAIMGLILVGWLVVRVTVVGKRELIAHTPQEAIRSYIAALRVKLFPYARGYLAWPGHVDPVELPELMANEGPLGHRFNTVGPAALGRFWKGRLAAFDDDESSSIQGFFSRYAQPDAVHLIEGLRNDELELSIFVVRARGIECYAIVPVAQLGDGYYILDGELSIRSGRQAIIAYHAGRFTRNELDTSGLLELCKKHNITRADAETAHQSGVIDDDTWDSLSEGLE